MGRGRADFRRVARLIQGCTCHRPWASDGDARRLGRCCSPGSSLEPDGAAAAIHQRHNSCAGDPLMTRNSGLSRALSMAALLAADILPYAALAAEPAYPTRPVRLVVPFAPGGGVDVISRILSPKLTDAMGQTWVVDNRAGAAGNLGSDIVAHASPDGYTVLAALNTQLTANPSLYKLPFSVEKDLQPVTMLCTAEHIVVIHPGVQAKTLTEFIALA